jgi:hypothetical protein
MDEPTTKASLLAAVRRERAEWERIVAEAGVGRMDEPGAMGEWTFKDLLAHLTAWQQHEQAPLEGALTGARPAPPWPANLNPHRDQDTINAHIHERTHALPTDEVLHQARRAWDRLEAGFATLPEEALIDPRHYPWLGGEALGPSVLRHVTLHYHQDHESDVRAWLARDLPTPESDPALRDVQAS